MKNYKIVPFASTNYFNDLSDFEEAIYDSKLHYSLRHLSYTENILPDKILEALQKSLRICQLAGIESKRHFKRIYVYDLENQTLQIDWHMSKKGFNLMIMQFSSLTEKNAIWLWKLAST